MSSTEEDFPPDRRQPFAIVPDIIWEEYLRIAQRDGDQLNDTSSSMNSVLTFTGLFAAVVAAFLVESYKSLQPPEEGTQAVAYQAQTVALQAQAIALLTQLVDSNRSVTVVEEIPQPPFHAPQSAVVVNTLWFTCLVISLLCALLATLSQEWTRQFARALIPSPHATLEQHARKVMAFHKGVKRYSLDRMPTLIVGLIHLSVIIFLIGLDLFLFPVHTVPAIAVSSLTGTAALFYVAVSSTPMVDSASPYNTPLTYVLILVLSIPLAVLSCFLAYCVLIAVVAVDWLQDDKADRSFIMLLDPGLMIGLLLNPLRCVRLLRAIVLHFVRPASRGELLLDEKIFLISIGHDLQQRSALLGEQRFAFLWEAVGPIALQRPGLLAYLVNCVVDVEDKDFGASFVEFRCDEVVMAKIAAAFDSTEPLVAAESVFAAVGLVRLLQLLLSAETYRDERSQDNTYGDHRWELMGPVVEAFIKFASQLGPMNEAALEKGDARIIQAASWLRWTILLLLKRVPQGIPDSLARKQCTRLLRALDGDDNSLRLRPLSLNDPVPAIHPSIEVHSRLPELAYRNVLTLLEGLRRIEWNMNWQASEDERFLNSKTFPSIWRWSEVFGESIEHRRSLPPSKLFTDLLSSADERLEEWTQSGSSLAVPQDLKAGEIVGHALRDLALAVNICQETSGRASTTPTFKRAEEGRVDDAA